MFLLCYLPICAQHICLCCQTQIEIFLRIHSLCALHVHHLSIFCWCCLPNRWSVVCLKFFCIIHLYLPGFCPPFVQNLCRLHSRTAILSIRAKASCFIPSCHWKLYPLAKSVTAKYWTPRSQSMFPSTLIRYGAPCKTSYEAFNITKNLSSFCTPRRHPLYCVVAPQACHVSRLRKWL